MIENDELKRVVAGKTAGPQEEVFERALRPRGLEEYTEHGRDIDDALRKAGASP